MAELLPRKVYNLWTRYRLTPDEFEALYERQDGGCAVCLESAPLHVDHDHMTGDVRGLLCSRCNAAIGHLRDNIVHLESLLRYLNREAFLTGDELSSRPSHYKTHLKQLVERLRRQMGEGFQRRRPDQVA